jgi:hypothetical protein
MVVTNSQAFKKRHGFSENHPLSLSQIASLSGISQSILQEVYNRGIGAYKTNPTSVRMKGSFVKGIDAPMSQKLSKEQWAMARVYSFVMKRKGTWGSHDADLAAKAKN